MSTMAITRCGALLLKWMTARGQFKNNEIKNNLSNSFCKSKSGSLVAKPDCSYMYASTKPCSYMYSCTKLCSYMYSSTKPCSYMYSSTKPCSYTYSCTKPCSYMYASTKPLSYMYSMPHFSTGPSLKNYLV